MSLNRGYRSLAALALMGACLPTTAAAQEQSRESAALDNTAAAWSFQVNLTVLFPK